MRRVFAHELTDEHRAWLAKAAELSLDEMSVEDFEQAIRTGNMAFWDWGSAFIGLSRTNKVLWVEFIVGEDLTNRRKDVLEWLVKLAEGRRIEALPSRNGMKRRMEQLGFKPIATMLRYEP